MSTVLVTGASGVLGRRSVPLLRQSGFEVVTSGRRDPDHPVDVTRPGSLAGLMESIHPDTVVHLAGGVATGTTNTWELNLLPGLELLHAAARSRRPPRLVLFGSAAEYGVAGDRVTEETATHPASDYGRAKNVQTMAARSFHRMGAEVLVLRPFNVVAADLPPTNALGNLRAQVTACRSSASCAVRCGRLDVIRDFVTAEFVALVIDACVRDWPKAPVLNVASGRGIVLGHLFAAFAAEAGVKLEYRPDHELVAIPAPDVLVADPRALEEATGLRSEDDVQQLARALVAGDGPSGGGEPT